MVVLVNRDPKWFFILVLEVEATLVLSLLSLYGQLVVEVMIAPVARVNPLVAHSNIEESGWVDIHSSIVIVELIENRCTDPRQKCL